MKKKTSLLVISCLSAMLLVACNEEKTNETKNEDVQAETMQEQQEMTLKEGRTIAVDLYKNIIDEIIAYGDEHALVGEKALSDEQVAELMETLKAFATGTYFEDTLTFNVANFCFGGCEIYGFDYYFSKSSFIKGEIENISANEIKLTDYTAEDAMGTPPLKYVTSLQLEDDTWKIANVEIEEVADLQMTEDEILTLAKNYYGYENGKVTSSVKQSINGKETTVYKVLTEVNEISLLGSTGELIDVVELNAASEDDEEDYSSEYDFETLIQQYYDEAGKQVMPEDYGDAFKNANTTNSLKEAKASIKKLYKETEKQVADIMSKEVDYDGAKDQGEDAQTLWIDFGDTMLKELIPNMSKKEANKLLKAHFKNDAYLSARVYEESGGVGTLTAEVAQLYYSFTEENMKELYEEFVVKK